MAVTQSLLDFILNLLRDPQAAAAYNANPDAALSSAGHANLSCADVDAVLPVVLDYAPVSMDREYNTGGNSSTGGDSTWAYSGGGGGGSHGGGGGGGSHGGGGHGGGHGGGGGGGSHGGGGHGGDDHSHAVAQLTSIVNNYTYSSSIDDRDTVTDQSVNQNIWADGDVLQIFDNDAIIASGDGAIAAGGSVAYNSFNEDDHSTNLEVDIEDSFNDNSDNSTNDSYNDNSDNSTNTEIDVEVEDSFNDNSDNSDNSYNSDNSTTITDSFQDNSDDDGIDNDGGDNDGIDIDDNSDNSENSDNSDNSTTIID